MEKLIDNSKYQVFIFRCRAHLPFFWASHTWVVVNKKGDCSRWEVLYLPNKDKNFGHLHINGMPLFQGIGMFPFLNKCFWKCGLIGSIEGDSAEVIIAFIEQSKEKYPHLHRYSLMGPNSNTYIQWILNSIPDCKIKLPWNCIGKNYIKKNFMYAYKIS